MRGLWICLTFTPALYTEAIACIRMYVFFESRRDGAITLVISLRKLGNWKLKILALSLSRFTSHFRGNLFPLFRARYSVVYMVSNSQS